jgi:drug/metabolite transporter (DMT)-like permease
VAALRVLIAGLVLTAIAGPKLAQFRVLSRRQTGMTILAGVLLGLHFGVWITSLYFTSTAASTALVATQAVFAALIGRQMLGEQVGRREWAGIAIATLGCAVLAGGDYALGGRALLGDALAVMGAASAAAYLAVGRGLREALPLTAYLAVVHVIAGLCLLVAALAAGVPFRGHPQSAYLAILGCALLPSVVGHSLLNWCVRRVRVHMVSLGILGEPVGASLLCWFAFAEVPPVHAALGGGVLLLGLGVGFIRRTRR